MHDIDGTQYEGEQYENGFGGGELEQQPDHELPLHETQELELASALLEVTNEMELESVLGDVFRAAGQAAGRFANTETGRALGGVLKNTVQQALPVSGGAMMPGLPGTSGVAEQAGSLLGLELEGLSPPDQEFETARQLVRFAGSAYRNAAWAPRNVAPAAAARAAAYAAARRYAPGLLRAWAMPRAGTSGGGWRGGYGPGSRYGYPSAPRYGAAPAYGSGYGYGASTGYGQPYSSGYAQPGTWYWRRRRRPWPSGQQQPRYWAQGAAAYPPPEPDPAAFAQPAAEPPPPPPILEPAPVAVPPPAPAEPTPPQGGEPATSGEMGYFPGSNGWGAVRGVGGPAARNGRWVRRGGVLIVYGA